MAWRFRRSKVLGPLRLTATKGGLGLSVGGPLGRVSVNTRGQVRETTRVPGIGLYQTRQVAQLGGRRHAARPTPSRSAPNRGGHPVELSVVATDLTGGVIGLDPTTTDVVCLRLVSLVDPTPKVATTVGIAPDGQGFTHGSREGVVLAEGAQWHAFVLIHPEDHPHLAPLGKASPLLAMHVGRLSAHDVQRWAARFAGRPLHVSIFIEVTPSMELIEVRFRSDLLAEPEAATPPTVPTAAAVAAAPVPVPADPAPAVPSAPSTTPPLPPAHWYPDPGDPHRWRYWDGARWTTDVAPR